MFSRDLNSPSPPSPPPHNPSSTSSHKPSPLSSASLSRQASLHQTRPTTSTKPPTTQSNISSPTNSQATSNSSSRSNSINQKRTPVLDSPLSFIQNAPKVLPASGSTSALSSATAVGSFKHSVPLPTSHIHNIQQNPDAVSSSKGRKLLGPMGPISRSSTPSNDSDISFQSASSSFNPNPESYYPSTITTSLRNRLPLNQMKASLDQRSSPADTSDSQISISNLDNGPRSPGDDADGGSTDSSGRENDELKFAASKNENLVLELSIDGLIRHLSSNWEDIVGTSVNELINKPASTIVVGDENDKDVFLRATEVMKSDESSYRVRFVTQKAKHLCSHLTSRSISSQNLSTLEHQDIQAHLSFSPAHGVSDIGRSSIHSSYSDLRLSALHSPVPERSYSVASSSPIPTPNPESYDMSSPEHSPTFSGADWQRMNISTLSERAKSPLIGDIDDLLEMEGQGVLIYDHSTGNPSHTMWIIRPYIPPKPLSVDLSFKLVHTLGFGVNILVSFLEELSEAVISDSDAVPTPPYELCRICERHVPTWWFERHSEICLVEHKTQSDLDSAHENLIDQRTTITHLLALLDKAQSNPDPPPSSTPVSSIPMTTSTSSSSISSISSRTSSHSTPKLEYRGISIPLSTQSPLSETSSPPRSPRITSQLGSASKRMLVKSFNLPKRSPVKLMELLIELCDLAVEINSPEIRVEHTATNVEGRIHSPQSESRIHCVLNWITPNVEDPALALLCEDTVKYARQKVDAALRLGNTITYFETIRHESEVMVSAAIEDTIEKATLQRQNDESIYQSIEEAEEEVEGDNEDGDDTDIDDNSSLFSESYLNSDALPTASASSSRHPPSLISRHNSTFGTEYADPRSGSVQTRSITPKSLLSDSIASSTPSIPNRPRSGDSTARLERAPTLEPPEALEFQLADLDLNSNLAYNRMQKKKSFSNLSTVSSSSFQGAPTAWTSIQRNRIHTAPSETAQSPSTPLSSPLIFPHDSGYPFDALNHRRQSSVASDIPRVPVSPLLTSTIFPPKPAPPSIKDYEIITAISKGAFGSVYLAKKKNTGDYFAIKVLKKADMIAKNQVMNVRAERAIMMSQSESPFVAKLFFTFQSKNYLYLVMEYLNGGDCAALVKVLGGLPEEWAQKYIAEVVLGVEDLHKKGIVHRDLKPDNLLINQDGHLKLTDFGLSRMGLVGRHTHQQSVVEGSSGFDSGSSGNIMQPKPLAKSITNPEVTRPSSTSSTGSVSGFTNPLLDSAISLVPEYFNLHSKVKDRRPTLSRSESNNSSTGEALFNASILLESSKLIRADEESISSNSSDNGGSLGSTGVSATPNNVVTKTIPLFDPGDTTRKFVGTPDYLAPETIRGVGQDEMSDWWSTGCILFEFLYGYPPFHAETPELVFENILQHNIQWPSLDESDLSDSIEIPQISDDARDLIEKLLCSNQEERIGAKGGAEEIRAHPFFHGINWDTLWDEEASFIPLVEDPESTDYFDSRGAESQAFPDDALPQDEDESGHKSETSYSDDGSQSGRSSRAGSTESAGMLSGLAGRKDTRAKLPLHIPPHVRDSRNRRLSEPVANDDFGSFAFKNLPMLDKANKDTLSRIKSKDWEHRNSVASESGKRSRGLSISTVFKRPDSPSMAIARHTSPVRGSANTQGSHSAQSSISLSPIITATSSVSSGPPSSASSISSPHRKVYPTKKRPSMSLTTMSTSPLSIDSKQSKFPGSNFLASSPNQSPNTAGLSSELYLPPPANVKVQTPGSPHGLGFRRLSNMESSPELGEQFRKQATSQRYPKVFDPSPSNSDTEEARGSALMRIQRRRELSRKGSQLLFTPTYRPLVVLICESNPVWRYSMETLLKGLNCRIISVNDAADAIRYATGDVKFDIIFTELRFANTSGADIARIIHSTSSSNTETPVVCVTNYGYEAANAGRSNFSSIITKPPTRDKLCEALERHCFWKPKETTVAPHSEPKPATPAYAEVGTESSSVITSSSSSLNSHKGMMKKKND